MKNRTQKIISLIIAIIAGFIDYINLTIVKSMCYYSGDGVMSPDLREIVRSACYEQYSAGRFLSEVILVSLTIYIVCIVIFSFFKKK